jgi:peptidoglycan/LPS O-acetylase OafA/YrhL
VLQARRFYIALTLTACERLLCSQCAYHCFEGRLSGGFAGVDMFFVISGYLISSIIYNNVESGTFSIVNFYGSRIRKIYPALFLVLLSACVAGWIILLPSSFIRLSKEIIGGSTFVANVVLCSQSG